jgi:hypothetical protein
VSNSAAFFEIVRVTVSSGLVFLSLCMIWFGVRLGGSRNEYNRNRSRADSWWVVFTGRINPRRDGARDDKVAAGLAIKVDTNEWVEQGRYSDEALHDALSH